MINVTGDANLGCTVNIDSLPGDGTEVFRLLTLEMQRIAYVSRIERGDQCAYTDCCRRNVEFAV